MSKKVPIAYQEKLDLSILSSVIMGLFCLTMFFAPDKFRLIIVYLLAVLVMILIDYIISKASDDRSSCARFHFTEVNFEGSVTELSIGLHKVGLYLSEKIGNHYFYKTRNIILRNSETIVIEQDSCCRMLLKKIDQVYIAETTGLILKIVGENEQEERREKQSTFIELKKILRFKVIVPVIALIILLSAFLTVVAVKDLVHKPDYNNCDNRP